MIKISFKNRIWLKDQWNDVLNILVTSVYSQFWQLSFSKLSVKSLLRGFVTIFLIDSL